MLQVEVAAEQLAAQQLGEEGRQRDQQNDEYQHRYQLVGQAVAGGGTLGAQGNFRLAHPQAGQQAGQHQQGKQRVSAGPGAIGVIAAGGAEPACEIERTGCRQQGGNPVARHIAGGEGSLMGVVGDFQAVGVNRDVLGGRGEGHHHGHGNQPGQVFTRIDQGHTQQAAGYQHLRKDQP